MFSIQAAPASIEAYEKPISGSRTTRIGDFAESISRPPPSIANGFRLFWSRLSDDLLPTTVFDSAWGPADGWVWKSD